MAGIFNSITQSVHKAYVKTAEKVMPTLTTSKFLEEGVLTPEEFVAAGDLLTYKCPTWTWEAGDPDKAVPYLPKDKQFLLTRNVPCLMRASSLSEGSKKASLIHLDVGGGDDEWVAPEAAGSGETDDVGEVVDVEATTTKLENTNLGESSSTSTSLTKEEDDDDDDGDIPDMDTFAGDDNVVLEEEDPAALPKEPVAPSHTEDNILRTRTYDLSITYDKYYQTPKVWLFGYDESRQPLRPEQVFQDISDDHAHKTVTIDQHPHQGISNAYIHPCRHAPVMKKIVQRQIEGGRAPRVDQYLFIFLKFISAAIPTIEYDYTMEMDT
eukprot:TRINITY_DN1668_c0_g1_i1.p1 TRINITY_DN1668_c0_g1~~TRINITY_DN1668_c0_g1_i1.p1  ORF type:complete len:324 (+),score=95.99 TRINITY_DN1668_c0_g1_i1:34-1005(+)